MMHKNRFQLLLMLVTLCCTLILSACGQKGPLYLPDASAHTASAATAATSASSQASSVQTPHTRP